MTKLEVGAEPIFDVRPLRAVQRNFVAAQLQFQDSPALNMGLLVRFSGQVDAKRLADSFHRVVMASDVLRTTIMGFDPENARVLVQPPRRSEIQKLPSAEVDRFARDAVQVPMDLEQSSYRSTIFDHGDGTTSWLLTIHHVATDATSHAMVIESTLAAYLGTDPEPSNYYDWVAEVGTQVPPQATSYWIEQEHDGSGRTAAGAIARTDTEVATASRAEVLSPSWPDIDAAINADFRLLTPDLSRTALLTLATAIYLGRSGADSTRIAIPLHHRNDPVGAGLIGPTLNMYPIEVALDPSHTIKQAHGQVARQLMATMRHAHAGLAPPPAYDAIVNVITRAGGIAVPGMDYRVEWIHTQHVSPHEALRVQATAYDEAADSIGVFLDVPDRPDGTPIVTTEAERFGLILRQIIDDPGQLVSTINGLTETEAAMAATVEHGPAITAEPIHVGQQLQRALQDNDRVALVDGDESLTGRELWRWVVEVADQINQDYGRTDRIAVELDRSLQAVVAIFAIAISGRSFVPINPDLPDRRKRQLREWAATAGSFSRPEHVDHARARAEASPDAPAADLSMLQPSDEAYVLFTSGSTGRPKGVPITHHGLGAYLAFAGSHYFETPRPVAPLYTALTFDLTITTLFAPLIQQGELHIVRPSGLAGLSQVAANQQLTWCKATPSHLASLLRLSPGDLSLRTLVVGGESFTSALARELFERTPGVALFNEYGPTEAVVGCMFHRVTHYETEHNEAVSIGVPAPGVQLRVVDRFLQRTPPGVPGELLIAHAGLTAGYLDGREADRFIELDGVRFYRSGDVVVRTNDAKITYLGRIDDEVKLGGIRLNPIETELALGDHPAIRQAFVRVWSPPADEPVHRCTRCGLADNVPGVVFDDHGVCDRCLDFDRIAPAADEWFKDESDLRQLLAPLRDRRSGDYDCVFLLSGGKDSTYGLYKLVELGFQPLVLTYDNGFISEAALDNARAATAALGVDAEIVTTDATNAILRDSLATFSNVCNGCYKTIYTLAINRAEELGIPSVVTGLSRGQLFETRLAPSQFVDGRFDPDAIEAAVVQARRRYHRAPDVPNQLLPTEVFDDETLFDRLAFIDIYRYLDIELSEVLAFLAEHTPWKRPPDTGRSSNCLVNVVGIRTHQIEQGYHNYAEPYAWDVRLGHKTRAEAIAELDDPIDDTEIAAMLATIGYQPRRQELLTAWFVTDPGERTPTANELRRFLLDRLPQWAIPSAFVAVPELATNANGKVDVDRLPPPERQSRPRSGAVVEPQTETERVVVELWETILGLEPLGIDDDFFALGGDSLAAITMIAQLCEQLGVQVRDEVAFFNTTPRLLAGAIEVVGESGTTDAVSGPVRGERAAPALSVGEQAVLWDQRNRRDDVMYNIGRVYTTTEAVDVERLADAITPAAARHQSWTWAFGAPRRRLTEAQAIQVEVVPTSDGIWPDADLARRQREQFDLDDGPLLRCAVRPRTDGTADVAVFSHHISCDHQTLDVLWEDIDTLYRGQSLEPLPYTLADLHEWQDTFRDTDRAYWLQVAPDWTESAVFAPPIEPEPDGYVTLVAKLSAARLTGSAGRSPVAGAVAAAANAVREFFAGDAAAVGLVVSTRNHRDAQRLGGYLLNVVPVRVDLDNDRSAEDILEQASVSIGQAMAHRAYPFAAIASDARAAGHQSPSASILVSYIDDPTAWLDGAPVDHRIVFNGAAVGDLTFFVEPIDQQVTLGLEYRGSVVSRATAERLLSLFDAALTTLHLPSSTEMHRAEVPENDG